MEHGKKRKRKKEMASEGNIYEIPQTVKELFEQGENNYRIINYDYEMDNIQSMSHFVECVGITDDNIIIDDGTQMQLMHPDFNFILQIDSGGLGDFYSHGFEVIKVYGEK